MTIDSTRENKPAIETELEKAAGLSDKSVKREASELLLLSTFADNTTLGKTYDKQGIVNVFAAKVEEPSTLDFNNQDLTTKVLNERKQASPVSPAEYKAAPSAPVQDLASKLINAANKDLSFKSVRVNDSATYESINAVDKSLSTVDKSSNIVDKLINAADKSNNTVDKSIQVYSGTNTAQERITNKLDLSQNTNEIHTDFVNAGSSDNRVSNQNYKKLAHSALAADPAIDDHKASINTMPDEYLKLHRQSSDDSSFKHNDYPINKIDSDPVYKSETQIQSSILNKADFSGMRNSMSATELSSYNKSIESQAHTPAPDNKNLEYTGKNSSDVYVKNADYSSNKMDLSGRGDYATNRVDLYGKKDIANNFEGFSGKLNYATSKADFSEKLDYVKNRVDFSSNPDYANNKANQHAQLDYPSSQTNINSQSDYTSTKTSINSQLDYTSTKTNINSQLDYTSTKTNINRQVDYASSSADLNGKLDSLSGKQDFAAKSEFSNVKSENGGGKIPDFSARQDSGHSTESFRSPGPADSIAREIPGRLAQEPSGRSLLPETRDKSFPPELRDKLPSPDAYSDHLNRPPADPTKLVLVVPEASVRRLAADSIVEPDKQKSHDATVINFGAIGVAAYQTAEKNITTQNRADFPTLSLARSTHLGLENEPLQASKAVSLLPIVLDKISSSDRVATTSAPADRLNTLTQQPTSLSSLTQQPERLIPATQLPDRADNRAVTLNTLTDRSDRSGGLAQGTDRIGSSNTLPAVQDRGGASVDSGAKSMTARGDESATATGRKDIGLVLATTERGPQMTDASSTQKIGVLIDGNHTVRSNIDAPIAGQKFADGQMGSRFNGEKSTDAPLVEGKISQGIKQSTIVAGEPLTITGRVGATEIIIGAAKKGELPQRLGEAELDEQGLAIRRANSSESLYFTGVEVAIAAVLAMSGAARLRDAETAPAFDSDLDEELGKNSPDTHKVLHRRTHLVSHGDTLLSIAEDLYQNQAVAWLIADLNGNNINEVLIDDKRVIELKSRQQLELPEAEEVAKFLARSRNNFEADKLVTVVSENMVDRELLNSFLGTVTGAAPEKSTQALAEAPAPTPSLDVLPALSIDMGIAENLPLGLGVSAIAKSLSQRLSRLVKRPRGSLAVGS